MPNFSSLARLEVLEKFLWVVGGVGWGLQSHLHVQPNHCAEVVLCCVVVWVVTITLTDLFLKPLLCGSSGGSGGSLASWQPLHVQLLLPGLDLLAQQFHFLSEDSVLTRPRSSEEIVSVNIF